MSVSLNNLYRATGVTRQGVHQMLNRILKAEKRQADLWTLIMQIRADHPTLSCRAMYHKLQPEGIGRDAFEHFCKAQGLSSKPRQLRPRTTDSSGVIRFPDLLSGKILQRLNEAWSSDITYFEVGERYYYITFVMDCFSRRILGYQVSDRLSTEQTTLPALRMAVANRGGQLSAGIIFHSDGGGQYYDQEFLAFTRKHKMHNSMCEWAWENGKAERLNGIIKNNYLAHRSINNLAALKREVVKSVKLYNTDRPHKSLQYQSPIEYENDGVLLVGQTKPKMTRSLEADFICEGV